jgi:hypothetical protein
MTFRELKIEDFFVYAGRNDTALMKKTKEDAACSMYNAMEISHTTMLNEPVIKIQLVKKIVARFIY